jgi:hypothetical protein
MSVPLVQGFDGAVDTWLELPVGLTGTTESSRVRTYIPIAASIRATINHVRQSLCSFLLFDFSSCIAVPFPLARRFAMTIFVLQTVSDFSWSPSRFDEAVLRCQ